MSVTIPPRHSEGLANLISLSDDESSRLVDALMAEPPALWPSVLAKRAAEKANLQPERVESIVSALISLIATRDRLHFSTDKLVGDITEAAA